MLAHLRLAFVYVLVLLAAGACEEFGRAIDEAVDEGVRDLATEVARLVPTPTPGAAAPQPSQFVDGGPGLPDGPIHYVASGDSVPFGEDMPQPQPYGSWLFRSHIETLRPGSTWQNISHSGDTSLEYIREQLAEVIEAQPTLVTVTIGADDILRRLPDDVVEVGRDLQCGLDEELSRYNLNIILFNLVERTDALVVVTTYYNPFAGSYGDLVQGCIDVLNSFIRGAADDVNNRHPGRLILVDISDAFEGHGWLPGAGSGSTYIQDCGEFLCVHPNVAGHIAISEAIWGRIESRFTD